MNNKSSYHISNESDNENDDDNESFASSVGSITQKQGSWDGTNSLWKGCICGEIHERPTPVFWIQCDGPCQAWYNVSPNCVYFDSNFASTQLESWYCHRCHEANNNNLAVSAFVKLPDHILYRIFEFVARGPDKVHALHKLSLVCSITNHAVQHKPWDGLWSIILHRDFGYTDDLDAGDIQRASSLSATDTGACCATRSSKRIKRQHQIIATASPSKELVKECFTTRCNQTDDAHVALAEMAESEETPLSLGRLRRILGGGFIGGDSTNSSLSSSSSSKRKRRTRLTTTTTTRKPGVFINRRSQFGRTFLHAICAADYVDEGVVLRCVREVLGKPHQADPNLFTTQEYPFGDCPALYFALSRVMPSVVKLLVSKGACLKSKVNGRFRLVSDPSQSFTGEFTPLGFARKLKEIEGQQQRQHQQRHLPPYWTRKLCKCIEMLEVAEQQQDS